MNKIFSLSYASGNTFSFFVDCGELKVAEGDVSAPRSTYSATIKQDGEKYIVAFYKQRLSVSGQRGSQIMEALGRKESVEDALAANWKQSVSFVSHVDNETGITYYTLRQRISFEAWKRVSHLFERNVELDMPEDGEEVLPWATRQPEQVKAILS